MYTIDAYDVAEWQATHANADTAGEAYRKARALAAKWPQVEVREPRKDKPENQPIAAWLNGRRQF